MPEGNEIFCFVPHQNKEKNNYLHVFHLNGTSAEFASWALSSAQAAAFSQKPSIEGPTLLSVTSAGEFE